MRNSCGTHTNFASVVIVALMPYSISPMFVGVLGPVLHWRGADATIEITGLRNPCRQLDEFAPGLMSAVLDRDDELDALKTQVFRELLTYMLQDPTTIEPSLDLILVSRHLERIGDHATNVAEDVIFMVSARDVRHAGQEQDEND